MSNILGSLSMVRNALDPLKLINDHAYHSGLLVWNAMKIDYLLLLARKSAILPIYLHTIRLILRKRSSVSIDSRNASFFHCNCNQGRGVLSLDNRAITEVWKRQKKTNGTTWIQQKEHLWKRFDMKNEVLLSTMRELSKISKVVMTSSSWLSSSYLDVKLYWLESLQGLLIFGIKIRLPALEAQL